ncbi:hypothetical protein GCM10023176_34280 [Micromonospora coerulea]|uniref:Uncharacterized protein n=1 Tax=Micromonospora coerulea TaxID=47856 RepID=A0ABP8SPS0_9ACTN
MHPNPPRQDQGGRRNNHPTPRYDVHSAATTNAKTPTAKKTKSVNPVHAAQVKNQVSEGS